MPAVTTLVTQISFLVKGRIYNSIEDTVLLLFLKGTPKYVRVKNIKEARYVNPPTVMDKANIDGTVKGQPSDAACRGTLLMYRGLKACLLHH